MPELIFDLMIGSLDIECFPCPDSQIVANEYEDGRECEKLYGEVYEANQRICERLGVEGDDVTTILNCMDNIARILAYNSGKPKLCFVVGGSYGLAPEVKSRADLRLSMSQMTFPHHLARVMLIEQIYRGFKINEGSKYHK